MAKSLVNGYSSKKVSNISNYTKEVKGYISVSATILVSNRRSGVDELLEWIYLDSYPNVVWKSIRVPSDVSYYNPTWPEVPFIKCGEFIELHNKKTKIVSVSKKRKNNMFFDSILDDRLGGDNTKLGD